MSRAPRCLLAAAAFGLLALSIPAHGEERRRPSLEAPQAEAPLSLRSWIAGLPPEQRRAAVRRLRSMPGERRARFFERWEGMDEAERRRFTRTLEQRAEARVQRDRVERGARRRRVLRERMAEMSPAERRRFRRQLEQWKELPLPERNEMRRRLRHFRTLDADEQEVLVDEQFSSRSAEERRHILEGLRAASSALR